MEHSPIMMTVEEQALYQKARSKNSDLTQEGFMEIRKLALQASDPSAHKFYETAGIIMDSKPSADELEEMEIHSTN